VYYYIIYMTCATQRFWQINKGAKPHTNTHDKNIYLGIMYIGVICWCSSRLHIVYQKSRTVLSDFYIIIHRNQRKKV